MDKKTEFCSKNFYGQENWVLTILAKVMYICGSSERCFRKYIQEKREWSLINNIKYQKPLTEGIGEGPQMSECIKLKELFEIKTLLEKDKAGYFASWQCKQLNDSNLVDPNNPWEIKGWILLAEACPSRRCH